MLSRLVLVIALLAGVALFIQSPAHASDRDGYYHHDRYHEVHRAPRYYEPRPVYRPRYYHPAPVYRDAPRYRHERYHHARRHDHHRRHHRDHYYRDRRW
ncbi:hypothetical protein D3C85_351580 [compost metagenome]